MTRWRSSATTASRITSPPTTRTCRSRARRRPCWRRSGRGSVRSASSTRRAAGSRELLARVTPTAPPPGVVLVNGRPPAIPSLPGRAAAILEAWFPGQDGAVAIAGALFGDINPGGKTTVSFSRSAGAQPSYYNPKRLAAGVPQSPSFEAVFPFGHGLSYTVFDYTDLWVSSAEVAVDGEVEVTH